MSGIISQQEHFLQGVVRSIVLLYTEKDENPFGIPVVLSISYG
jgi:hypothetical protein